MQVVDDSITAAFSALSIAVFDTDFVEGVTDALDLIAGGFAAFKLLDQWLYVRADAALFPA